MSVIIKGMEMPKNCAHCRFNSASGQITALCDLVGWIKIKENRRADECPLAEIQPEPQWIPCRETVDIPDHEILACDKYGEEMFGYLSYEDDQWLCESDGYMMYDPIAWREKPEPYRGEGEQCDT